MDVQSERAFPPYVADAGPRDCVRIDVQDNGTGISPDHLEQLFDPFFTTKDPGKGTGLGLSLVKQIMIRHQGNVTVESKPGQGSRFSLYFPVKYKGDRNGAHTHR